MGKLVQVVGTIVGGLLAAFVNPPVGPIVKAGDAAAVKAPKK